MKKLLFLLLLVPFGVTAQETKKWEIGLNTAAVFSKMQINRSGDLRWRLNDYYFLVNHMSLSAYRNFTRVQVGLKIEGGLRDRDRGWVSPQAVVNYRIPFSNIYVYGGAVAGYVREQVSSSSSFPGGNGFVTGLQAGAVIFPGKRFGINLETGVRFNRTYRELSVVDPNGAPLGIAKRWITETYIPVSLGVRYRF